MTTPEPKDYLEIQNLYARYNLCSDAGDAEGYAGCFTEDGALELPSRSLRVAGHTALVQYKMDDKNSRLDVYRRHWNASMHLEQLDATTIRGRAYYAGYNGVPGKLPGMTSCGVYTDTIVKTAAGWRFQHRLLEIDGRA